ncbi:hypothetical protein ABIF90_000808 [Bradyrhizobium japonicum]
MVMRDGSCVDDLYYAGGDSVTVKVLIGRDDAEWRTAHLNEQQATAWREFAGELPWLNASHRCIVGIASVLRARMQSGAEMGSKSLSLLRLCLSSLGATPADASKVAWAPAEEPDDLLD